jgi:hypothetical protein
VLVFGRRRARRLRRKVAEKKKGDGILASKRKEWQKNACEVGS